MIGSSRRPPSVGLTKAIGIPIAFVNPTEGGLREEPIIGLFYVSIAGAIIIILYSSMQTRKEQQRLRRERRKKFRK